MSYSVIYLYLFYKILKIFLLASFTFHYEVSKELFPLAFSLSSPPEEWPLFSVLSILSSAEFSDTLLYGNLGGGS